MREKILQNTTKWLPALALFLGVLLRLAFLGSVPGGTHQDEGFVAWNAYALLQEGTDSAGHVMPVYLADWGDGHSAMYVWLLMPLLFLNGGHVTTFLGRLPQAVVAILTLWAVYLLVRRMLGREAGLWSLFLLAVCPWHIMMSRWGLDANLAPGFLMFGLYFFMKGLEREKYLLLSALFYGLSLYCYAVIWPIVPVMLFLQILYGLCHRRLKVNRCGMGAALLLFLLALPLICFVLVNSDLIPEISLPFFTIPKMGGYRGGEIALSPQRMWSNLRTALSLLWHQNTGAPYDILLPWGLFYDIGRVFMVIGAGLLLWRTAGCLRRREFCQEYFLFVQLVGGGLVCLLVTAVLHQINALYIPLVLCEAYGVWRVTSFLKERKELAGKIASGVILGVYLCCLALFQRDYYTDYRQVADAYFGAGLRESVEYALEQCGEKGIYTVTAEKGAQWPRLLLFSETLPSEYLESVVYDEPPAPASFRCGGITVNTRIHYDEISRESIYIFYYTDVPVFEEDFELTRFHDWYVGVPKTGTCG